MIAYFYIDKDKAEDVADCGLKLSLYGKDILFEENRPMRAIMALISPKDDMLSYKEDRLECLKLDIPKGKLLVSEEMYLYTGNLELFNESVVHAENYIFGTYRKPCYIIPFTVSSEYISILDKTRDVPVLYDDSEEVYIHSVKAFFEDIDEKFYDNALYGYLDVLARNGKADIEWQSDEFTIFNKDNNRLIIRNPIYENKNT